jgi:hypothetical protein
VTYKIVDIKIKSLGSKVIPTTQSNKTSPNMCANN